MTLNVDFTSNKRILNIVPKKTLKGRDKKTDQDQISSIRKKELDAALVRIMKSNRRMDFSDLAKEVRKVIEHFPPSDRQLRQVLDDLIQREYLERDDDKMNIYIYKA